MTYQFFTTDVFTKKKFSGAPIAVFPKADGLNNDSMLKLAKEMNQQQTVFVHEAETDTPTLRVFTPLGEMPIGSHTTVAAAHVLSSLDTGNHEHSTYQFNHNTGQVSAFVDRIDKKPAFSQVSLNVKPSIDFYTPTNAEIADMLMLTIDDIEQLKYNSIQVATDTRYLIVPLRSLDALQRAKFNLAAWMRTSAASSLVEEILLFSTETETSIANFHFRLVGPEIANNVFPPVGGVIPAFSAYLCSDTKSRHGTHMYSVERGFSDDRQSFLEVEFDHKGEETLTVRIGGAAVVSAKGEISLAEQAEMV